MPFKSKAQERWANTPEGKKALGGQSAVDEWAHGTNYSKLPDHVKPKKPATKRKGKK
jgi:hypothetical protein